MKYKTACKSFAILFSGSDLFIQVHRMFYGIHDPVPAREAQNFR